MRRSVEMIVTACENCPFFERGVITALGDLFAKSETSTGQCKHSGIGIAWPFSRQHVEDKTKIPSTCPLREGDAIVKLAGGK